MTTFDDRWKQLQRTELAALRRHGLAVIGIVLLFILGCVLVAQFGVFLLEPEHSTWLFAGLMVLALLYALSLGAGLTMALKRAERSVSFAALLVFWVFMLSLAHFAEGMRAAVLLPFLALLMLATTRVSAKQLMLVSLLVSLSYFGVLLADFLDQPRSFQLSTEVAQWLAFSAVCFGIPMAARRMSLLRQREARARRSLIRLLDGSHDSLLLSDPLTGLFNRRYLLDVLHQQKSLADRFGIPFAIVYIDLDHLKDINNLHGNRCGDQVLAAFARFGENYLRHGDELGRLGEDTFLLVLPQTDGVPALNVAQRLRRGWSEQTFMDQSVSLSAAVVTYQAGDTAEGLLHRGRMRLEQAKKQGRNRVLLDPDGSH